MQHSLIKLKEASTKVCFVTHVTPCESAVMGGESKEHSAHIEAMGETTD